jgi:hypothetical protein
VCLYASALYYLANRHACPLLPASHLAFVCFVFLCSLHASTTGIIHHLIQPTTHQLSIQSKQDPRTAGMYPVRIHLPPFPLSSETAYSSIPLIDEGDVV